MSVAASYSIKVKYYNSFTFKFSHLNRKHSRIKLKAANSKLLAFISCEREGVMKTLKQEAESPVTFRVRNYDDE